MNFRSAIRQLRRGRTVFAGMFAGIPDDVGNWKPSPDRWSAVEIAAHLKDIEIEDFREDVDIILHRPEHPWPSFDEMAWVDERRYNDRELAAEAVALLAARDGTLEWLEGLEDPDPQAPYQGERTPQCFADGRPARAGDLLASWVAHDLFHIRQLALLHWDILNRPDRGYSPKYSGFEP